MKGHRYIVTLLFIGLFYTGYSQKGDIYIKTSLTGNHYSYQTDINTFFTLNGKAGAGIVLGYRFFKHFSGGIFYSRFPVKERRNNYEENRGLNTAIFYEFILPDQMEKWHFTLSLLTGKSEYQLEVYEGWGDFSHYSQSYLFGSPIKAYHPRLAAIVGSKAYYIGIGGGLTFFPLKYLGLDFHLATLPFQTNFHFSETFGYEKKNISKRTHLMVTFGGVFRFLARKKENEKNPIRGN